MPAIVQRERDSRFPSQVHSTFCTAKSILETVKRDFSDARFRPTKLQTTKYCGGEIARFNYLIRFRVDSASPSVA